MKKLVLNNTTAFILSFTSAIFNKPFSFFKLYLREVFYTSLYLKNISYPVVNTYIGSHNNCIIKKAYLSYNCTYLLKSTINSNIYIQ